MISAMDDLPEAMLATHWHRECVRTLRENQAIIEDKKQLLKGNLTGGKVVAITTVSAGACISWNDVEQSRSSWFKGGTFRLMVTMQQVLTYDSRLEVQPWRGQRHILSVHAGRCVAIVVTPQQAAEADIHKWLLKSPTGALQDNRAFILDVGASLYVPFGMTPVVVGLPTDPDALQPQPKGKPRGAKAMKLAQDVETVILCVHLLHDAALDSAAAPEVRSFVASTYVSAANFSPACMRENDGVKEWYSAISKVPDAN